MRLEHSHPTAELDAMLADVLGSDPLPALAKLDGSALWDRLADHAWRTQCGGFLAERLTQLGHDIPNAAARQLRAYCEHVAADNTYKANRAAPVFAALNLAKIRFLVLKGLAIGAVLYESPSVRPMTDIDVLIDPQDAERADRVLVDACGCGRGEALVQDDFYPNFHYEREYITPHSPGVKIDLHARPFRPLRYARTMPNNAMWDGGEIMNRIGGEPIAIPSRENMLIHLCVHAACHGLRSLRWLYDIKRWIEQYAESLNWNAVVTRCEQWQLSYPMRLALQHTAATFSLQSSCIRDAMAVLRCNETGMDRIALWQAPHGQTRPVTDVLVNAICSPGLGFRMSYLRAAMVPSREHLGQIYSHRHWGWVAAAHAYRVFRCVARPFHRLDEEAA